MATKQEPDMEHGEADMVLETDMESAAETGTENQTQYLLLKPVTNREARSDTSGGGSLRYARMWTEEQIEKLLNLLLGYPSITDPSHADFKDKEKVADSWDEIAVILGKPTEEVRNKWKNVKDHYIKLKRKHAMGEITTIKWRYFDLVRQIERRGTPYKQISCLDRDRKFGVPNNEDMSSGSQEANSLTYDGSSYPLGNMANVEISLNGKNAKKQMTFRIKKRDINGDDDEDYVIGGDLFQGGKKRRKSSLLTGEWITSKLEEMKDDKKREGLTLDIMNFLQNRIWEIS